MDKRIPSFDSNRSVLGEIFPLNTPFTVILDSSELCNFRCKYCFRGQDDKTKWGYAQNLNLMDWDIFVKAVSQIQEFPEEVHQISLSHQGEPLCNRKLPDMVRYIKSLGIKSRISIHTNAALLDEEYARDLADSDIDRIIVSLQGLSSKKYREVCKANVDFEQFYYNLSVLYKQKKHTNLYFKIIDVALDDSDESKFYEMFTPIGDRVFVEKQIPLWKGVILQNQERPEEVSYNKYGVEFPEQECCPLIFDTIVVDPSGDVYPCTQLLTPYILGNIRNDSLVRLWNSEQRKDLLIRQCKGTNPNVCKGCFILKNSIYSKEDMIDAYRADILKRLTN